jgi:hypothetical protein
VGNTSVLKSWGFLQRLGVDLPSLNVSRIKRLQVSDIKGDFFEQPLPLGGFGISRYKLDHTLAQIAKQAELLFMNKPVLTTFIFLKNFLILNQQKEF